MWTVLRAALVYVFTMGLMAFFIAMFAPAEEPLPLVSTIALIIAYYGFPLVVVIIDFRENQRRKSSRG
jgi:hypothetical protein